MKRGTAKKRIPITLGIVALLSTSTFVSSYAQSITWLGRLGGDYSTASDVSDNGIVRAVRWTQAGGIEDLNTTYAALIRPGWRLTSAAAISSNGRYIVGVGESQPEGGSPR